MNNPLISVILPVYNAENHLADCLKSLINQSYQNFEIIAINDGSIDSSQEILEKFAELDNRIICINNRENNGLLKTLNIGLEKARGEYVARMDSDDISHKERLNKQLNFMINNPDIGICGSWIQKFGTKIKYIKLPEEDLLLRFKLLIDSSIPHPTFFIRAKIIDRFELRYKQEINLCNDEYFPEDYNFLLDISRYSKLAIIPDYLLKYRLHNNSISTTKSIELRKNGRIFCIKKAFKQILNWDLDNTNAELCHNFIHAPWLLNHSDFQKALNNYVKTANEYIKIYGHKNEIYNIILPYVTSALQYQLMKTKNVEEKLNIIKTLIHNTEIDLSKSQLLSIYIKMHLKK